MIRKHFTLNFIKFILNFITLNNLFTFITFNNYLSYLIIKNINHKNISNTKRRNFSSFVFIVDFIMSCDKMTNEFDAYFNVFFFKENMTRLSEEY